MKALKQLTALLIVITIFSSNSIAYQKEVREVESFSKISLRTSINVYLTQGNTQKIELSGDKGDFEKLETKVKDGKLIIDDKNKDNWGSWSRLNIDVHITVKNLDAIAVAGSGDMVGRGKFKCDDLEISVAGSGDLELEVDAKDIDVSIAGSGSVLLSGTSEMNKVSIAGSGKLDAEGLEANICKISIAGSGSVKVHAKEEINSKISGSGSIYYKGDPSKVNNNSSGSGKIRKM